MKIQIVGRRHGRKTLLAEVMDAAVDDLPVVGENIRINGKEVRVLSVIKTYQPESQATSRFVHCVYEVDVT